MRQEQEEREQARTVKSEPGICFKFWVLKVMEPEPQKDEIKLLDNSEVEEFVKAS